MNKKLKLILTYDHELPLGGWSGSFDSCLFGPTDEVLKIGKECKVPVTLFTDILSAYRFKDWDCKGFFDRYVKQINNAISMGHEAQLHIHPHWLTSQYSNSIFTPSQDFKLADFSDFKNGYTISSIIQLSIDFLNEICQLADSNYKCIAYRAGGFNLSPCTNEIVSNLYQSGIRFDSSINKGFYYKSALSEVDYRKVSSQMNWFLETGVASSAEGKIYEIPVAGVKAGLIINLQHLYRKSVWKNYKHIVPGKTIHSGKTTLTDKLKFVFSTRMLTFDLYTLTVSDLVGMVKKALKELQNSELEVAYLTTISHPKSMGTYNMQLMRKFIQTIQDNFKEDVEFINYGQAWDELKSKFN